MRNVICMKWGSKYGSEYVNKLSRMVARHLSDDYRFVCYTDDIDGIDAHIETMPLPTCRMPDRPITEAWRKLSLFGPDIGISGPTLFLDLDVVIVDRLDVFFEHPGAFCIIHNWTHQEHRIGNSSVFRFVPGAHPKVFEKFAVDPDQCAMLFANEQIFLSGCIDGTAGLTFWPEHLCKSFKKHCVPRGFAKLYRAPRIPGRCSIVVFHGNPNPPEAARRYWYRGQKSFRLPKFIRPAPWISSHWR